MIVILFSLLIVIVLMKYMTPPTSTVPERTITDYDHKTMDFFKLSWIIFKKVMNISQIRRFEIST